MSWTKEQVLAFAAEEVRIGRLATVSAEGDPHVVPIWYAVDGDRLLVHTVAESRKAQNIIATGKYAITIDKDTLPYKGVTVSGRAEAVGDDVLDSRELVVKLAVAYMGPQVGPGFGESVARAPGTHVTLVLHVDETESWDFSRG
jgi:PPOX class probable F420-dependent enzyme